MPVLTFCLSRASQGLHADHHAHHSSSVFLNGFDQVVDAFVKKLIQFHTTAVKGNT